MEKKGNHKDNLKLNLPKTGFPMKADLARLEPRILEKWESEELYRRLQEKAKDLQKYILHDGPPYANGHIHIGHALNKILKDIIVKSKIMSGHDASYVPGWDCHGLPIEHQVLKELGPKKGSMTKLEIRKLCREYADKFIKIQMEEFKRLGVLGDWDNPYLTMTPDYEAAIVREFGKVVATGGVYRGKKPVLWCPFDETALAEAEVEYNDHTSPSIYVKFPLRGRQNDSLLNIFKGMGNIQDQPLTRELKGRNLSIVIWTTTPWTLAANRAVALHPSLAYVVCLAGNDAYIVAGELFDRFRKQVLGSVNIVESVGSFTGAKIEGWEFSHPWLDRLSPVVIGEHVTLDQGTGCVHTAPGHGEEDYEIGLRFGLEIHAPVDNKGRFTSEVEIFAGQKVFEANKEIIKLLKERDMLLKEETITHSYPHCWRCKNPVIFRATEQWFISMEKNGLRKRALKAIEEEVTWIPKWGKERILGMMQNRPDWCISRQRDWGVPIVAFICLNCKTPLISKEITDYISDLMGKKGGSDIWFSRSADELLPDGTACPGCKGGRFKKEDDILDVWFESGVSYAAVLKNKKKWRELEWPADLYLEGSDQHRGWFHSSLLASILTDGRAPYKAVLTHGFVVDGTGKKMSKSAGNVVAPQEVITKYGAEILRLWAAASDYREDVRVSEEILGHLAEAYRKIRNTCRFLLGNLYDFDPDKDLVPDSKLTEIDRWALHTLQVLIGKVRKGYKDFEFHLVFHSLNNFCAVEMSSIYLDILKDRLYTARQDSVERRSSQTAIYRIFISLVKLMAPLLSFTAEELWGYLPKSDSVSDSVSASVGAYCHTPLLSVYMSGFPEVDEGYRDQDLESRWKRLMDARENILLALEKARQNRIIGGSLEASVHIFANEEWLGFLKGYEDMLPFIFIVSRVSVSSLSEAPPETDLTSLWMGGRIDVGRTSGSKCERCWNYSITVGKDGTHPLICERCISAIS